MIWLVNNWIHVLYWHRHFILLLHRVLLWRRMRNRIHLFVRSKRRRRFRCKMLLLYKLRRIDHFPLFARIPKFITHRLNINHFVSHLNPWLARVSTWVLWWRLPHILLNVLFAVVCVAIVYYCVFAVAAIFKVFGWSFSENLYAVRFGLKMQGLSLIISVLLWGYCCGLRGEMRYAWRRWWQFVIEWLTMRKMIYRKRWYLSCLRKWCNKFRRVFLTIWL